MGSEQLVSVAMPVREPGPHLGGALRSILQQTHANLDVMVVVNPGDRNTPDAVRALAGGDGRVRILERPRPGLAAALNFALREARSDLVARMDSDDRCSSERIAAQVAALEHDPRLSAIGCAFVIEDEASGREIEVMHPPTDPEEVAWRLLLGNVLAHGSMVMRRGPVLSVGGYDESIDRGQDYDLWVRMIQRGLRIACVSRAMYTHRIPASRRGLGAGDGRQADAAARVMVGAWGGLPVTARSEAIAEAQARCMDGSIGAGEVGGRIAAVLREEGPTREGLLAWLWCRDRAAMAQWPAMEAGRAALVREKGRMLRDAGVARVWVWGAGAHTRWILDHAHVLEIPIAGVVDDACVGARVGDRVAVSNAALAPGEHVLLSSDTMEDRLWEASAAARERGVVVHRLYRA